MAMTDTPNETPKPKPRHRRANRKRAAAEKSVAKVPPEFEGLSPTDCCDACNEKQCVISGMALCSHPFKGGLRPQQMVQPEVVQRYKRAKRALGEAKLNLQQMAGG